MIFLICITYRAFTRGLIGGYGVLQLSEVVCQLENFYLRISEAQNIFNNRFISGDYAVCTTTEEVKCVNDAKGMNV